LNTVDAEMKRASVYIETFGCQMNVSDTERAVTSLRAAGYALTADANTADVILFNTCSVRARAEQRVFNRIGEVRHQRRAAEPVVGIMGCVAQLEGELLFESTPSLKIIAGTRATDRLPELLKRALNGESRVIDLAERREGEQWDISPVERHSPHVAFVPIVEGCNKFCTYCIVPYSRGRERSRTPAEIIAEINKLIEAGYQEVHLIGQNVNSYRPKTIEGMASFQGATPFSRLLRAIAATGMPRIKYTTSFPRDFHADIVAAMDENENLCNWVHLPVQSGSDKILRAMRRGYTAADYLKRVEMIFSARRRYALTSDIIIGFPSETAEDFALTKKIVQRCQYDSLYIFKYSKRDGTPAANLLDEINAEEKRERFLELEELQKVIQRRILDSYIGKTVSVLVEGRSAKSTADMTGHTTCNKVINFKAPGNLVGKLAPVHVTAAKTNSLYGEIIKCPA